MLRWRICAKVLEKSGIFPYINASTQDGRRFYTDVSDSTGTIRIAAFGDEVDKFYSKIEVIYVNNIWYHRQRDI